MSPRTEPFVVMLKPFGSRCNMRCSYCYYLSNRMSNGKEMDYDLLETVIRNYFSYSRGPVVSFVFHGGEPTVGGIDFYRKAVELEKKYLPEGFQCWNNLQTNGLGIDDEWCRFLKENNFDVGVSIDGIMEDHDFYRRDSNGHPTFERIRDNIALMGSYGMKPDILCTVNDRTVKDPLKIYSYLRDLDTGWIQFIPVVNLRDGLPKKGSITAEEYGRFLCEIFNEWVHKDFDRVGVQLFMETLNVYSGGEPTLCWLSRECGKAPVIEADGRVYSCDHFVDQDHLIGDVSEEPLSDIMEKPFQKDFGRNKRLGLSSKCHECRYLKVCNGGCPKDRVIPNGKTEPVYYLCEGLKQYFEASSKPLRYLSYLMKRGYGKKEAMRLLNERE